MEVDAWKISPDLASEFAQLKKDLADIGAKIVALEHDKYTVETQKRQVKCCLADAADANMGDVASSLKALEDKIKKSVKKALQKAGLKVSSDLISEQDNHNYHRLLETLQQRSGQLLKRGEEVEEPEEETGESQAVFFGPQSQEAGVKGFQAQEAKSSKLWQLSEGERKVESIVTAASLRYGQLQSWPDEILMIPTT